MEAVLRVPDAVLVLLGYGPWRDELVAAAAAPPYLGRVFVLDAVTPDELLAWIASADAAVMAIEDTSPNYRFTTPNKLFEAMAAGVPVVASDLPGMAAIVRETGCGVLVDPGSVESIAEGLRQVLLATPEDRAAMVERCVRAHLDTYDWENQEGRLLELVRPLAAEGTEASPDLTRALDAGDQLQPAPSRSTWRGRVACPREEFDGVDHEVGLPVDGRPSRPRRVADAATITSAPSSRVSMSTEGRVVPPGVAEASARGGRGRRRPRRATDEPGDDVRRRRVPRVADVGLERDADARRRARP